MREGNLEYFCWIRGVCEGENPGDLVYIREGFLRDVNRECLCWTTER